MADMLMCVYGCDIDKFLSTVREHLHNEDSWYTVEERDKAFENFRDKVLVYREVQSINICIDFDDTQYLRAIYETLLYVECSSGSVFSDHFSSIHFDEPLDFLTFINDFIYNYNDVFGEYEFDFIMEYINENKQLPELGLTVTKKHFIGSTESYIFS